MLIISVRQSVFLGLCGSSGNLPIAIFSYKIVIVILVSWFRGSAVERWSLTGEHSLSCARPTADG